MLFILSSKVHELCAAGAVVLLFVIAASWCITERRENRRVHSILEGVFVEAKLPAPKFVVSRSFSFPFFKFSFLSQTDYQRALESGALIRLKENLQREYANSGHPKNPFDIERAVDFDYPEKYPG